MEHMKSQMQSQMDAGISENESLLAEIARLKGFIGMAYGYLWCVNNEPGTPNQYPPEKAAYEARKLLRDTMTHEQRGDYIHRVVTIVRGIGA